MRTTRVAAVTAALAVALGTLVTAANASDHGVRMNEIQLLGSHNSYHRELSFTEKKLQRESDNLWYSHASLPVQFEQESVRQIEIDVIPDSDQGGLYTDPFIRKQAGLGPLTDPELAKPGIKVMHVADYDYNATCSTLVRCLQQVKGWSDTHPDHAPIPILIELKKTDPTLEKLGGVKSPPWDAKQFDRLDNEIRSVLGDEHLITPDTIRHPGLTLEQSVLHHGWPTLNQARGKLTFLMDNKDQTQQAPYLAGRPNLEGRVLFTDSAPGRADAAFIEENDPTGPNTAKIQALVRKGYFVRTRSDEPFGAATSGDTTRLEAALASGAQMVSTDFPVPGLAARYGTDYVAELPGRVPARCNPMNAPQSCHRIDGA